jgi:hypothetical protein
MMVLVNLAFVNGSCHQRARGQREVIVQQETQLSAQQQSAIEKAVERYLSESKNWKREQYRLEQKGTRDGMLILWVIFLEDEKPPVPGGGQSVELEVDLHTSRVVRELGFQ